MALKVSWLTISLKLSWHIFTGIGVYIFMVLVECLRSVSHKNEMTSAGLRISSSGTWPFMVFVEDTGKSASKKKSS